MMKMKGLVWWGEQSVLSWVPEEDVDDARELEVSVGEGEGGGGEAGEGERRGEAEAADKESGTPLGKQNSVRASRGGVLPLGYSNKTVGADESVMPA